MAALLSYQSFAKDDGMPYVCHGCTTINRIWDSTGFRVQFRGRISQGTSVSASEVWQNSGLSVLSRNDCRTLTKFGSPERTVLRHDAIHPFTLNTYVVDVTEADVMTPHRTDQLCVTACSLQVQ
jgi:hypothetical protein